MIRFFGFCGLLLPIAASAHWQGKGELGAAQATANTGATSTTWNAKFDLANEIDRWKHAFGASTVYNSTRAEASETDPDPRDETAAKRWEVHEQTNYNFSARAFWFGAGRYEHDNVGSFRVQESISSGVGYKFIDDPATTLIGQLGLGYKRVQAQATGDYDNTAIGTAGLELKHVLTETTVLLDKLAVESGSGDTEVQNNLALQVKVSDKLSLALGYQLRYYSNPGRKTFTIANTTQTVVHQYAKTDRLLTANLVYEFK